MVAAAQLHRRWLARPEFSRRDRRTPSTEHGDAEAPDTGRKTVGPALRIADPLKLSSRSPNLRE
jgi:hypothetical protein